MRITSPLSALVLALGATIGFSTPAHAAVGPWAQVSTGGNHTCAINVDRSLYCWGDNTNGQIGKGSAGGNQTSPYRVGAAGVWASVSAGGLHTCGITNAKNLYCWGQNTYGQIGKGSAGGNQLSLYRVGAEGVWASLGTGGLHTCGITNAKNLYCWGSNGYGQIGNGTDLSNQLPLYRVAAAGVWANVTSGSYHTCGITNARNLYCWGANDKGQIGTGNAGGNHADLYRVGAEGVWANVGVGASHTCGITNGKSLYCWGDNTYGQIGKGSAGGNQLALHRVGGIGVWANGTAGAAHTCELTLGKNLYCWGYNENGQTGNGVAGGNQLPHSRVGATGVWASTSAGNFHTCGITTAQNLYCWGNNSYGQIGKGASGGNQLPLYRVL